MDFYNSFVESANYNVMEQDLSPLQKKYAKFFKDKLSAYNVKSPSELSGEDKKKFFNEIKSEWKKEKSK